MKILAFGEVLWDIYPHEKFIGGAPFNFGAHGAMQGAEVYIASSVGTDELGKEAVGLAEKFNINTDYICCDDTRQTGKCLVTLDENKIPSYNLLEDVAYDYIQMPDDGDFDVLYFGTLAMRGGHNVKVIKKLIESGRFKNIFVDINVRKPYCSRDSVMLALQSADYIKISDEELSFVADICLGEAVTDVYETVRRIGEKFKNLKLIILTMGEKGSYVFDCKNQTEYSRKAKDAEVVSTVGAGDSFSASFLVQLLKGSDIGICLDVATVVSGFVVSRAEAVPEYNISDLI